MSRYLACLGPLIGLGDTSGLADISSSSRSAAMRRGYSTLLPSFLRCLCPLPGTAVGHVCDKAKTDEMNRHLAEISDQVQSGGHAVIILNGAGWHRSNDLLSGRRRRP